MARQTARRRAWTAIALLVALAALATGGWALQRWQPFADDDAAEVTWPDSVEPLAEWVEDTTRLRFTDTVDIEFIEDQEEFAQRAGAGREPGLDALAIATREEAVGRALGWWGRTTGIAMTGPRVVSVAGRGALWLADERVLLVKADDDEDELSGFTQREVVRSLVLALHEQRFDMQAIYRQATTPQDLEVALALDWGHARWVTGLFTQQQEFDEDFDYFPGDFDLDEIGDDATPDQFARRGAFPSSYLFQLDAPLIVGSAFFEALAETNKALIAEAFTTHRPTSLDQMVLPAGHYLTDDPLEAVEAPAVPVDGELVGHDQMGHTGLFSMFALGVPWNDALTAADGWGNDALTIYLLDDRLCVDGHVVADSRADADLIEVALNGWATTRPEATDPLVARDGIDLYFSACDPGTEPFQTSIGANALAAYSSRLAAIRRLSDSTGSAEIAECMAVKYFAELRDVGALDVLGMPFEFMGDTDELREECAKQA